MEIRIFDHAQDAAVAAADIIADVMKSQKKTVLGLATGSTPVPMYQELARRCDAKELDFSNVYTYNLDEYIGLDGTHDQSYRYFMDKNLFDHINIDKAHTHVPCGTGADHAADAKHYDEMIEAEGGIDVQVLTDSTIDANKRFFEHREDVPKQAITLGMGGIMSARKVIMLAFGKGKADAVRAMVNGEIDPKCPASILQLHRNVTVLLDREAAAEL